MLATYRLQLTDQFTFFDAFELTPYLKELGISTLYLSPIFEADPYHGYHITDPNQFSSVRGGEAGFLKLASSGMQLLVDIVPNHLAPKHQNSYWRDPQLRTKFFDLDKDTGQPRCFFNYGDIAGVKIEDEEVFNELHRLIARLCQDGLVHGLRIDHPDGLADPIQYLHRLQKLTGFSDQSIWIEKFLAEHEPLLAGWPAAGTVGMEFLRDHQDLFIAPHSKEMFKALYSEITDIDCEFADFVQAEKKIHARETFRHYVDRLHRGAPGIDREELIAALVAFDSRTFIRGEQRSVRTEDQESIGRAKNLPPSIKGVLTLDDPASEDFLVFFQQCVNFVNGWSFLTALWMHNRWVALNEWGCNPDRWHLPVERFHEHQKRRLDRFPRGLLSRQTHDTFHSSDARARMVALTHRFKEWQARVNHWFQLNKHAHFHPNIEYRVYQDLCSVWPIEKDRFLNHIRKWFSDTNGRAGIDDRQPNRERLTLEFAERLFENTEFLSDLDSFVKTIVASGRFVAMGQLLLQLTSPGIPDIYWGDELEVFSLADPDQRRPVDWTKRKQVLAKIQARCCERASVAADSREIGLNDTLKMRIIVETLRLRNQFASVFSHGAYEPVNAGADVCAFTRGGKVMTVVPLTESAKKLDCLEGWSDLFPDLPVGLYVRTEGP